MDISKTDVVAVGGGGSGLAAALAAGEKGARVIVLEARPVPGGTTNFPAGIFAVESRMQKERGIHFTKNAVFARMMEYSHYMSHAALTKAVIEKSAATIDWLQEKGVQFVGPMTTVPGEVETWHLINGGGAAIVKALVARGKDKGVDIRYRATAKSLIKNRGLIEGVVAVIEGKEVTIKSRAVILATGGYGSNKEWMKKYTGFELGKDMFPTVNVGLMGAGQRMAWDAGAAEDGLGLLEIEYDLNGPGLAGSQLRIIVRQPYLWVNLQGDRLGNEDRIAMVANYAGNVLNRQAKKQAFLLFDEDTRRHMETRGWDRKVPPFVGKGDVLAGFDEQLKKAEAAGNKDLFAALSLEDLCAKTGINLAGLKETLARYNNAAEKKTDDQFGKDPQVLHPVKKGPFYAFRITPTMLGTLGGLKVNSKLEVLDPDDIGIPGLYAVGNIASGMYGDTYCIVFSGTTLGFAINSGRIAGENAAEYTQAEGRR